VVKEDGVLPLAADSLPPKATTVKKVSVPVSDVPKGSYDVYFGIRSGVLPDAILSEAKGFTKQ